MSFALLLKESELVKTAWRSCVYAILSVQAWQLIYLSAPALFSDSGSLVPKGRTLFK